VGADVASAGRTGESRFVSVYTHSIDERWVVKETAMTRDTSQSDYPSTVIKNTFALVLIVICLSTTQPAIAAGHYADNTSEATRDIHRQAIAHLQGGRWQDACDLLDTVSQADRRRLTDYLTLLCSARLPDRALSADEYAVRAIDINAPAPALLNAQRDALDQHRAWIAAIQDDLADAAKAEFQLKDRPLPKSLQGTKNLTTLKAWRERGIRFNAATYKQTIQKLKTKSLATQLAIKALLSNLVAQNANAVLFADLSGMTLPAPPALSLPADTDL
jgi:hypothetical protein